MSRFIHLPGDQFVDVCFTYLVKEKGYTTLDFSTCLESNEVTLSDMMD